jgi:hypothetical protein
MRGRYPNHCSTDLHEDLVAPTLSAEGAAVPSHGWERWTLLLPHLRTTCWSEPASSRGAIVADFFGV